MKFLVDYDIMLVHRATVKIKAKSKEAAIRKVLEKSKGREVASRIVQVQGDREFVEVRPLF